jgi:hypothetical protein
MRQQTIVSLPVSGLRGPPGNFGSRNSIGAAHHRRLPQEQKVAF